MGLRSACVCSFFLPHSPLPICTTPLQTRKKEKSHQAMLKTEKDEDFDQKLLVEQDKSFSECSSGCQSGWTLYLCQSQNIPTSGDSDSSVHEGEEEGMSMLSDASSGPPRRVPKDDYINSYCCSGDVDVWSRTSFSDNGGKRRRVEEQQQELSSLLDDTARSPLLCFSKTTSSNSSCKKLQLEDVSELSCDFSATHFKGKAAMQKHLDYTAPQNPAPICSKRNPL